MMHQAFPRLLICVACVALSGLGLLFGLFGLVGLASGASGAWSALTLLIWLSALIAWVHMAIAWIRDTPLGAPYSRQAFLRGIGAIAAIPLFSLPQMVANPRATVWLTVPSIAVFELLMVSPMVALAIHLNRYHRQ